MATPETTSVGTAHQAIGLPAQPFFRPRPEVDGLAAAYMLWHLSRKVNVSEEGCWEWAGSLAEHGYGVIDLRSRRWQQDHVFVHRLVYELCVGPLPEALMVCHRCDNPPCCNPAHLFLGTNADNVADKVAKGRQARLCGDDHARAILSEADVAVIRGRAGESPTAMAAEYGVTPAAIRAVIKRRTWKHVP